MCGSCSKRTEKQKERKEERKKERKKEERKNELISIGRPSISIYVLHYISPGVDCFLGFNQH